MVNLESMTSKPNAGGGSKNCVAWKVEKAVHYCVHADKATMNSPTDKGKKPHEGVLIWGVAPPFLKLYRKLLDAF